MRHYKLPDGRQFPSVTAIIGDCTDKSTPLTFWAANCVVDWIRQNCYMAELGESAYYKVQDEQLELARKNFRDVQTTALDIGSEAHHAIENFLKTGEEPKDPRDEVLSAFLAFLEFADEHKMETLAVEERVVGDCFAGTLDWRGMMDGKRTILDWKTNKGKIYKESHYQIAAYRSVVPDIEACGCVRIDKETGYADYKDTSKTYEQDLVVFDAMLNLFFERHPIIRKKAGL